MYQQTNDLPFEGMFLAATRQFADAATRLNRLAVDHAGQVFGLQLAAFEQNARATFAFLGEVAEAREADQVKAAWPKGLQVARDNAGRAIAAGQDTLDLGLKAQAAIAELARAQFEAATGRARATADTAARAPKGK